MLRTKRKEDYYSSARGDPRPFSRVRLIRRIRLSQPCNHRSEEKPRVRARKWHSALKWYPLGRYYVITRNSAETEAIKSIRLRRDWFHDNDNDNRPPASGNLLLLVPRACSALCKLSMSRGARTSLAFITYADTYFMSKLLEHSRKGSQRSLIELVDNFAKPFL